jgi:hypothetical protein
MSITLMVGLIWRTAVVIVASDMLFPPLPGGY